MGVVNQDLLQREDVAAYMKQIDEKVTELSGSSTSTQTMSFPTHSVPSNAAASRSSVLPSSSASADISGRKSVQCSSVKVAPRSIADPVRHNTDEDAWILDVNPEEDMQIIDQLLELQQHDQEFQEGQKDNLDCLDDMEGEIKAQQGRLLQLCDNLKVYHNMKDKYERLMGEVHSLESEKQALADELEKAQVDPTKGCSQAVNPAVSQPSNCSSSQQSSQTYSQPRSQPSTQPSSQRETLSSKITIFNSNLTLLHCLYALNIFHATGVMLYFINYS